MHQMVTHIPTDDGDFKKLIYLSNFQVLVHEQSILACEEALLMGLRTIIRERISEIVYCLEQGFKCLCSVDGYTECEACM